MKKRIVKALKWFGIVLLILILIGLIFPTWTAKISGDHSISELRKVQINDTTLDIMIRGSNRDNPVILFAHGGPCCSEIPYVKKYQDLLEEEFTIVHYDQRGSGKSYRFTEDYSDLSAATHVQDLLELTKYIEDYMQKDKVILIGHSYGTYIAAMAASREPELYEAYVGIGQMSNTIKSEMYNLQRCIEAADAAGNTKDVSYLKGLESSISNGEAIAPRSYVRKYGFAARSIDDNADYVIGFLFGSEYNLLDIIRFYAGLLDSADQLLMETLENPITDIVTELNIPVYFVMGKYDGMTSPKAAEEYLHSLGGSSTHEYILFEYSAHYPQFEEKEEFFGWMCDTFINK